MCVWNISNPCFREILEEDYGSNVTKVSVVSTESSHVGRGKSWINRVGGHTRVSVPTAEVDSSGTQCTKERPLLSRFLVIGDSVPKSKDSRRLSGPWRDSGRPGSTPVLSHLGVFGIFLLSERKQSSNSRKTLLNQSDSLDYRTTVVFCPSYIRVWFNFF